MKKLKRFRPMLILLLIAILQFGTLSQILVTYAEDGSVAGAAIDPNDITGDVVFIEVDLRKDTGSNGIGGTLIGNEELKKDIRFGLYFDFKFIRDDQDIIAGNYLYIPIPEQIKLEGAGRTQDLDFGGVTIATATYDASAKAIKVLFTDQAEVNGFYGVEGDFWFFGGFDESKFGAANPEEIKFELIGKSINVSIDRTVTPTPTPTPIPSVKPTISKSGTPGTGANWNVIDWKITIDSNGAVIDDWSIVDLLGTYQEDITSVVVKKVDGATDITSALGQEGVKVNATGLTIDFKEYALTNLIEGKYEVTFKTKLKDDTLDKVFTAKPDRESFPVTNQAELIYNSAPSIKSNEASVTIPTKLLKKEHVSGSGTITHTDEITWKITVNESGLPLKDVKVLDVLDSNMEFVSGSVKVGAITYPDPAAGILASLGDITGPVEITYKTKVNEDYFKNNQNKTLNNTATLTWTGGPASGISKEVGVGIDSNVIKKSGNYDASTGHITWTVVVNSNKMTLATPTITDDIKIGQRFVPGSFKVQKGNGSATVVLDTAVYNNTSSVTKTGTLTYVFDAPISDTYTITFKTLVLDPKHRTTNSTEKYYNAVTIKSTTLVGGEQSPPRAETTVTSKILAKTAKGYDYKTRLITWEIILNQNNMELTDVVITDNIAKGLTFIASSLTVNGSAANAANFDYTAAALNDPDYAGKLTYTFPSSITTKQTITFKTEVTELKYFAIQNNGFDVWNSATLSHDDLVANREVTETAKDKQPIENDIVKKKAVYTSGKEYIDWVVDINSNAVDLNGLLNVDKFSLVDKLASGLELDTTSVELYRYASIDVNGIPQGPENLTSYFTKDNIKYDATTNVFEFVFPKIDAENVELGGITKNAYQLRFTTDVVTPGTYGNTISLNGAASAYESDSQATAVSWNAQGGGARGTAGKLTIIKQNADGTLLEGAEFELIDQYDSVVKTGISNNEGKVEFKGVPYNKEFRIKEAKAPTGYVRTATAIDSVSKIGLVAEAGMFKVQLPGANKTVIFENELIKSNVEFVKEFEPLAGSIKLPIAEFKLFARGADPITDAAIATQQNNDVTGIVSFTNVTYGDYDIYEVKVPEGYVVPKDLKLVAKVNKADFIDVAGEPVVTVQLAPVKNELIKANIKFDKKDDSGNILADAEFKLYQGDVAVATAVSKLDGTVEFKDVLAGTYSIRETNTPFGYVPAGYDKATDTVKDFGTVTITNADHGATLGITTKDEHGASVVIKEVENVLIQSNIEFNKVESRYGNKLSGAQFGLFDSVTKALLQDKAGKDITAISDTDGKVLFANVGAGSYIVKEISAPTGYKLNETEYKVSIAAANHNGKITIDPVINTLIEADVSFKKLSNKSGMEGIGLEGAKFYLKPLDTKPLYPTEVYETVSDVDGNVLFKNVPFGKYELHEAAVPVGYNMLTGVIGTVDINALNQGLIHPLDHQDNKITEVTNYIIKGDIEFVKAAKNTNELLENARFALYAADDKTFAKEIATAISNNKGIVKFENVEYGDYTIIEIGAPSRYYLSDEKITASITSHGVTHYPLAGKYFENVKMPEDLVEATIEITKVNTLGHSLAGAKFALYDVMGTLVAQAVTNSSGIARFTKVSEGAYTVKELEAPKNYVKSDQVEEIAVSIDQNYVKRTFVNERSSNAPWPSVTVQKVDETGAVLAGVKFALYEATDATFTNPIASSTTNADGVATFIDIIPGKYVVKEIEALKGYVLSTVTLPVIVTEDAETFNAGTVENRVIRGDIVINKVNERNKPLQGAEFGLFDAKGKLVTLAVSDIDGIANLKNIPYGSYTLKELTAPESYKKSDVVTSIEIRVDGSVQTFTFENRKVIVSDSNFGDEETEASPGESNNKPNNEGNTNTVGGVVKVSNQLPKTGDSISTMIWLFAGSGLLMLTLLLVGRRRTQK